MTVRVVFGPAIYENAQVVIKSGGAVSETTGPVSVVCVDEEGSINSIESAKLESLRKYVRANADTVFVLPEDSPARLLAYLRRGAQITTDQSLLDETDLEPDTDPVEDEYDESLEDGLLIEEDDA